MRKLALATITAMCLALSPALAEAQSAVRATIRDGDVWELNTADPGGFVEFMISWTKRADFDIEVFATIDGGETYFTVCMGQSFMDGFERCHFGQGQTSYLVQFSSFSGARSAKGAVWLSYTDESVPFDRDGSPAGLRYRGNINDERDDPALLMLSERAQSRPTTKKPIEQ